MNGKLNKSNEWLLIDSQGNTVAEYRNRYNALLDKKKLEGLYFEKLKIINIEQLNYGDEFNNGNSTR